ncbi:MAG TPA: hypothetical protein VGL60_08185 [Acidimicrobiales bacterium]
MEAIDPPTTSIPAEPQGGGTTTTEAPEDDYLTCPMGHRFPRAQLTIRNGQFVCPTCDRTPWATSARPPWARSSLREPAALVLAAAVMLLAEMVSVIGLAAAYSSANVGGAAWLIGGGAISLIGGAVAVLGAVVLVRAVSSGSWTRERLSPGVLVLGIGGALLAVGDLVSIGFNVSIMNSGSPGSGWELASTVFDALFFAGLAAALVWTSRLVLRPDPDPD